MLTHPVLIFKSILQLHIVRHQPLVDTQHKQGRSGQGLCLAKNCVTLFLPYCYYYALCSLGAY